MLFLAEFTSKLLSLYTAQDPVDLLTGDWASIGGGFISYC